MEGVAVDLGEAVGMARDAGFSVTPASWDEVASESAGRFVRPGSMRLTTVHGVDLTIEMTAESPTGDPADSYLLVRRMGPDLLTSMPRTLREVAGGRSVQVRSIRSDQATSGLFTPREISLGPTEVRCTRALLGEYRLAVTSPAVWLALAEWLHAEAVAQALRT